MTRMLRALVVEDVSADAELMVEALGRAGFEVEWERVEGREDYLARLDGGWDVILADYTLPAFDAMQALDLMRERGLDIPFIVVTGTLSEETAVACLHAGAADYLFKDRLGRLGAAVERALEDKRVRDEKQRAEEALRRGAALMRVALATLPVGVWIADAEGKIVEGNRAGQQIWVGARHVGLEGYGEYRGWWADTGQPIAPEEWALARAITRGETSLGEVIDIECFDGSRKTILSSAVPLRDGDGTITGALAVHEDITGPRRQQARLQEVSQRLQALVQACPLAIMAVDARGRVEVWNPAAERIFGWTEAEVIGLPLPTIPEGEEAGYAEVLGRTLQGEALRDLELRRRRKDGSLIDASLSTAPLRDSSGAVTGSIGILLDISERRRMEAALRQAQKMEAVGQLAGGIAHDFNNLLTVITGRAELALRETGEDGLAGRSLALIRKTADRAAAMTRQLLAFSRRQTLEFRVLDPNEVVQGLLPMLRRLIGEDIELITLLDPGVGRMRADVTQIEQVILNLALNARDAMPHGGPLTIETANVVLDQAFARDNPGAPSGPHVMLAVRDAGTGMDAETQSKIFEPFFTTKPQGQGTGLGLATVYGIVKQHEGWIRVQSAPGRGTSVSVYLRRVEDGAEPAGSPAAAPAALRGSETVLLVEDEESVRETAREILAASGYAVLEARDATQALLVVEQHRGPIHLLLTDMIMPGMSGAILAGRITALRPETKVLYMSGYSGEAFGRRGMLDPDTALLQKPFTAEGLAHRVREVLGHGS